MCGHIIIILASLTTLTKNTILWLMMHKQQNWYLDACLTDSDTIKMLVSALIPIYADLSI